MATIKASMAGSIWKIVKKVGDSVLAGEDVIILESMKMEIPVASETSGTIKEIAVHEGDFVNEDDVLIILE